MSGHFFPSPDLHRAMRCIHCGVLEDDAVQGEPCKPDREAVAFVGDLPQTEGVDGEQYVQVEAARLEEKLLTLLRRLGVEA